jgi:hypothetical protein
MVRTKRVTTSVRHDAGSRVGSFNPRYAGLAQVHAARSRARVSQQPNRSTPWLPHHVPEGLSYISSPRVRQYLAQYTSSYPPRGCVAGALSFCSGSSVMSASVVSISAAMLAAFCKAERATLVGSTTPAAIRSS